MQLVVSKVLLCIHVLECAVIMLNTDAVVGRLQVYEMKQKLLDQKGGVVSVN